MPRKRKKKSALIQKILAIGGILIVLQVAFIFYFQRTTNPTDIRDAISSKIEEQKSLPQARREQMKVQLALHDFRVSNGKFPATLNELIPKYFEQVPIDPETGKPFAYTIDGDRFFLGERSSVRLASAGQGKTSAEIDTEEEQQAALIASLDAAPQSVAFVYDPTGKRDPFRPFDLSLHGTATDCEAEPLTCWDIGQLRLTVVMSETAQAKAIVEDNRGRGYIVSKGTKIGRDNGEVVEILPDRLKILETTTDFTGETKTNVVEMMLRTKDQQQEALRPSVRDTGRRRQRFQ